MYRPLVIAVLLVYVGMHVLTFLRLKKAYRPSLFRSLVLITGLCIVGFTAIWPRLLERGGHATAAYVCGVIGHTWMVVLFWFSATTILFMTWGFAMGLVGRFWAGAKRLLISDRRAVGVSFVLIALAFVWGLVEAQQIRIREIVISTPHLSPAAKPIRIAQISDLHIGKPQGSRFVEKVVSKLEGLRADVILSTGDLIDSHSAAYLELDEVFLDLAAPLGKFAVTGNHEYYTGLNYSLGFHEALGFRVLREEWTQIVPGLVIAGIDDSAGTYTGQPCLINETALLKTIPPDSFVVLLKHQPLVVPDAVGLFDLQLSGHTHGGQVFPFELAVRLLYSYGSGMHRLSDRSLLYVSPGTGVWGTPLRVLAQPEITLFVIVPSAP